MRLITRPAAGATAAAGGRTIGRRVAVRLVGLGSERSNGRPVTGPSVGKTAAKDDTCRSWL